MKTVNGKMFREMVMTGAIVLHNNHPEIDALNVFPVPDGDTGTNMSLTFTNGSNEVEALESDDLFEISKKLSKGLLMGARGNSGVILSQIFRGVSKSLKGKTEVNAVELADAFANGAKVAYKAVMRPVEGTILTVIREASEAGVAYAKEDMEIEDFFSYFVKAANDSLDHTPELLPVLKEVGVVDSGGAGLLLVLTGFLSALAGETIERIDVTSEGNKAKETIDRAMAEKEAETKYDYQLEYSFKIDEGKEKAFTAERFKNELERLPSGNIKIIEDNGIIKANVATDKPGNALNVGQRYGTLGKIEIKNITEVSFKAPELKEEPEKEVAIISVSAGEGIKDMFMELHCDFVVSGGQTMNPATEDLVEAIRNVNAKHVIVLPNNSNIIMTAQQAATVLEDEIDVIVIPSKTIPQGLSACIMYNTEADLDTNVAEMTEALSNVKTGQVTFAIKDTNIDGLDIRANEYMALQEKKITACMPNKLDALKETVSGLADEDSEVITLICGEDITKEEKEEAKNYIENNYDAELEVVDGKQPVYSFIVGIE
ncbi:DAK2 domain fusion protein YloV [Eggerthia catenaformis OT 569 = DSM 20559]|uniref:DAK2 domain fusion protein YloV n=1 Tax=Eggerthia catenaformis OT 569 = DSM 20559 TaxID=999415 RepID=M2ND50_9FIRM|nr:DAK2 domain-containing protein [Eggerthia catenaformis]EMD16118.1 DAK2 domain fusion protein YloV [Eggerthia catenaformis OT 569 = DSM 20559]